MKILCIGPIWRGSNAGGLFKALNRQGALIEVVDEFYNISLQARTFEARLASRLIRPFQIKSYNQAILAKFRLFKPDIVFVYKGAFILPNTILSIKSVDTKVANFYPDVSMFSHGRLLPTTMGMYDLVFSTKTFGLEDLKNAFGINNSIFIPHGFDPDIHRIIPGFEDLHTQFNCDVSFIGTWSPLKASKLEFLYKSIPGLRLKIWGNQWEKCKLEELKTAIQYKEVVGDLYAIAIQSSAINLGLLSERVTGATSGDKITSRTFHIPGSGGFLLHERNEESILYYRENEEAVFFEGLKELVKQVKHYLESPEDREKIRLKGHHRALKDHSLDNRAKVVLKSLKDLLNK